MKGDLLDGTQLGTTAAAQAANATLLALSRAGRSFLLYDAHNEAIRAFLEDYKQSHARFAEAHGSLELTVRPFELVYEGEVVYLERDRERSLAFKMFRDGVRKVTLRKSVTWDELLRLLEILSIRYTGVRQSEDDLVTLLWKAGFKNIDLEAIEGVVPDEEDEEEDDDADRQQHGAPDDRDLPLPTSHRPEPAYYDDVEEDALAALREEVDTLHLPSNAVRLSELLLTLVADPVDPTDHGDVRHYLEELRDFLMAEEQLGTLVAFTSRVQEALHHDPALLASFHSGFGQEGLRRIVRSIQKNHTTVPAELLELLALVPGRHLEELVALLGSERDAVGRRMVRQLIERYAPDNETWLMGQILAAESDVARDLLRALGTASPDMMVTIAPDLATHSDTSLLEELLWQLDKLGRGASIDRVLLDMLNSDNEAVAVRAAETLARRAYHPALENMVSRIEHGVSHEAAEAMGAALSQLNPREAQTRFRRWIRPGGLRQMMGGAGRGPGVWAAMGGLERMLDPIDDDVVEFLIKKGDKVLAARARACLVRRRHLRGEG